MTLQQALNYDPLFCLTSTGKIKTWSVAVVSNDDNTATIIRRHGLEGGTLQENHKVVHKGKNLGKTNETTPLQQAMSEAHSLWQKKYDEGYRQDKPVPNGEVSVVLPMLAHNYEKRRHDITWPCYVQPKMDGMRMLVTENLDILSRAGKPITTVDHLRYDLAFLMEKIGKPLDGELYIHDASFQEIMRLAKKKRPESVTLEYWVYDYVDTDVPFSERSSKLTEAFCAYHNLCVSQQRPYKIRPVLTLLASSEDEARTHHQGFVADGYEGIILRNASGTYTTNYRSKDLQKWKFFKDQEFEIIGGKEGTGLEEGCVIFTCKAANGMPFDVRPRGTREDRKAIFANLNAYIGKPLTVRFQQLSEDGIPIFPVGHDVRTLG